MAVDVQLRPTRQRLHRAWAFQRRLQNFTALLIEKGLTRLGLYAARFALAIDPQDTVSMYNAGLALQLRGRRQQAADLFGRIIVVDPRDRDALLQRAEILCDLGRWQAAVDDYTAALALQPRDGDALLNRGAAYGELGAWDQAETDALAALALWPEDRQATRNLERVRRKCMHHAPLAEPTATNACAAERGLQLADDLVRTTAGPTKAPGHLASRR